MSEDLKKLTGKNKNDYETTASHLINNCDTKLFAELVENDDFLFDFVKENTAQRLEKYVNPDNYKNLLHFLKYYSPYYEDLIVGNLVKFADEELTDILLEKFENGNNDEKTYAAKYFEYIKDTAAYDCLVDNAYSANDCLAQTCAHTLSVWQDEKSYETAISKLKGFDDFEILSAVKFLAAYGRKDAVVDILKAMKASAISENIAGEIPYLIDLEELIAQYKIDGLLTLNHIINGLGEILPLCCVFDYNLYDVFEALLKNENESAFAVVILNAQEKFDTLTENDEYLFDENKDTKNEIKDIKHLLKSANRKLLEKSVYEELREDSPFIFTALEFAKDEKFIRELLKSNNQTVILKTAEVLKDLGCFDETARTIALLKVTDINIKEIIRAM